ncbi:hypothetical protein K466DRAFT_662336 [Polyporus arcularius HHB13444]|uniref:HNH nuclease domain-containing protein n=1 Tax=Polyporus arcularius HHB13444 TaxID=1314778 RepID=A0A5C3PHM8_9APHY|nr:hypothetical protein K466DRAFT_662336 [Polyporus arcularius HHB13444]
MDPAALTIVRVFVQLPDNVPLGPNPDLAHWEWHHILSIPISVLNEHRFSLKPYKWIRFVAGVIFSVEGDLKLSKRSEDAPCDYEISELANESFDVHYHIFPQHAARFQPVDPDIFSERLTVTHLSSCASSYAPDVADRDGGRCVLTGNVEACDAVHVIPRIKGDEYIGRLTERNGVRGEAEKVVVDEIDDIRNGIYLQTHLHRRYGPDFAFLQTPNFAMLPSDVPGPGNVLDTAVAPIRCTVHAFKRSIVLGVTEQRVIVESGSSVRTANANWPPPVLFDATYASLVLNTFGVRATVDAIKDVWQDELTLGVPLKTAIEHQRLKLEERRARQTRERAELADGRGERARVRNQELDDLDLLFLIPYVGVPPQRLREYWAEQRAERELDEQRQSEAKVSEWRDRCATAGL